MQKREKQSAVLILAAFFALTAGTAVWACSSMGPDKHIGMVKAIDAKEGTLTLIDAETGKPLQFATSASVLKGVKVNDKAVVTFKTDGERLVAKDLVVR